MTLLRLHNYWRSSSSHRVRIALGLKGLAYEYAIVDLVADGGAETRAELRRRNPMAQVPVLEVEHEPGLVVTLAQSVAICEYLEERFPDPPLLPSCKYLRARVRKCVEIVNSGIQPFQNLRTLGEIGRLGGDAVAFARGAIERGLEALELEAQDTRSRCLVGDEPTLADVFLAPQLASARRFGVELARFPALGRIDAELARLPAFVAAHPERQPDAPAPAR